MPTEAAQAFEVALSDVDNLLWFHENEGGNAPGRRGTHYGSLNKSAIVLLCAAWETYIESVVLECCEYDIDEARDPNDLQKSIQKLVASHIRTAKDEGVWRQVAGDGWKNLTRQVLQTRVAALNSPKPTNVSDLVRSVLGVTALTKDWEWHKNDEERTTARLTSFVKLRGAIAHGATLERAVTKHDVTSNTDLIRRLVKCVDQRLVDEGFLPPHLVAE